MDTDISNTAFTETNEIIVNEMESKRMSEQKRVINFTFACLNEFAQKYNISGSVPISIQRDWIIREL